MSRILHAYIDDVFVGTLSETLVAEFEARTDVPHDIRSAQIRMLRSIQHIPVATMVKQLKNA